MAKLVRLLLWGAILVAPSIYADTSLHLLIPGAAGGGWDRTARAVGEALGASGLVHNVTFENMSGGGGGKALAHLIERQGANTLMVNSTPIVVRSLQGVFPQSFRDLVPIASMIGDYSVLAVRKQSAVTNLAQLAAQMRTDPRTVAIAGGSVSGGTDHIVAAMIFSAMGTAPQTIKYIPYDAGGKAMGGLLSGEVQALSSGYGEVVDLLQQDYIRLLCVAAATRLPAIPNTPTCTEAGAEGAVFVNWRGFFAPPNTTPRQVTHYRELLKKLTSTPAWATVRDRYGWVDLFRCGVEFTQMLERQEAQLGHLLKELDLL